MTLGQRLQFGFLTVLLLANSWLLMQVVHECGHVLAAMVSGDEVERVVLHPMVISQTDVIVNPHPLFVAWSGVFVGILIPLVVAFLARNTSIAYLLWAFAGFCLIANGIYMGIGVFDPVGDAWDILFFGGKSWQLGLYALCAIPPGFYAWHRVSPAFGLSGAEGEVNPRHFFGSGVSLVVVIIIECIYSAF